MARAVDDEAFAAHCRALFESGSRWMDAHLFNGEYYEHEIRPPGSESAIASGLRHASMGARDLADPELQLGAGCLADQLVGQCFAHVCGLGHLLEPQHVRTTLQSLMRHNFQESLHRHFNHLRTYALADEAGMLVAAYPRGRRPARPFPYCNEVWTGLEYTAAAHMLYEGLLEDGLRVIEAVRARYDGRKRSPFDEAECGHHYARAMASWAAYLAATGFHYSAVTAAMRFARSVRPVRWFWSTGEAWGVFVQSPSASGADVRLEVLHGAVALARLEVTGVGFAEHAEPQTLQEGQRLALRLP
jgi:non-lysosomal glucosylceramidase